LPDAEEEATARGVTIFRDNIIYHVIDNYLAWYKGRREAGLKQDFETIITPAKLQIMPSYIFRRAKPAIFGVEVLTGNIKPKCGLIRAEDGEEIGEIQQIQDKGEAVPSASKGMQIAISVEKPIVGRHIFEKDVLYVKVPEAQVKMLQTTFIEKLTPEEQETLNEYVSLMRKKVPFWGA
jgi:translation initiation factor 5B